LSFCSIAGTLDHMTPKDLATTYFDSWRAKDFETFRSILADDATFRGPLGMADGADELVAGIEGMSQITTGIEVERMLADGPDVLTWFQLGTKMADPTSVASWIHAEDGRITRVRVTFDPREIVGG
jgi:ketosteroid isomerase-like protein